MIYKNITDFLKKRTIELIGLAIISSALLLAISFFSYSPNDPTLVYGTENVVINNLLGVYGGQIADFLLQSFGLASFLILITITVWGVSLIVKKEIKKVRFKILYIILYLIFVCISVHATFNNSFWLIDHGNSGFVGQLLYNSYSDFLPNIKKEYIVFISIVLSLTFFILASNISIKNIWIVSKNILKIFKKNNNLNTQSDIVPDANENLIENNDLNDIPQQSFPFVEAKDSLNTNIKYSGFRNFKLPSVDLLEKNLSKINILDQTKNRPDSNFIEKILLDFGINGKITKINNGPVVSLYEFEPAPGIKVSKIINLSDDLARNTSSTSARVSIIPGKNTVGIEIPNESRESVYLREIISNEKFQKKEIKLPISLGKSISGIPIVGDLT